MNDIENSELKILRAGLSFLPLGIPDSVTLKYGFKYEIAAGCIVHPILADSIREYNQIALEYLRNRNGEGWLEKLDEDINWLCNSRAFKKARRRLIKNNKRNKDL